MTLLQTHRAFKPLANLGKLACDAAVAVALIPIRSPHLAGTALAYIAVYALTRVLKWIGTHCSDNAQWLFMEMKPIGLPQGVPAFSVLQAVTVNSAIEAYDTIQRAPCSVRVLSVPSDGGPTTLRIAALTGKLHMFEWILSSQKQRIWSWGPVPPHTCMYTWATHVQGCAGRVATGPLKMPIGPCRFGPPFHFQVPFSQLCEHRIGV